MVHSGKSCPGARGNGEFAGVVVGILDPQLFDKAWTFNTEIAGLSIALTAADGTLIMRRPLVDEMMGRSVVDAATRQEFAPGRDADSLLATSPFGGAEQIVAYRRGRRLPQPAGLRFAAARCRARELAQAGLDRRLVLVSPASLALGALGLWLARVRKAHGIIEERYPRVVRFHSLSRDRFRPGDVARAGRQSRGGAALRMGGRGRHRARTALPARGFRRARRPARRIVDRGGDAHRGARNTTTGMARRSMSELVVRLMDYGGRPARAPRSRSTSPTGLRAEKARQQTEELPPAVAADGHARPPDGRHRARFQQHPHGHHGQRRGHERRPEPRRRNAEANSIASRTRRNGPKTSRARCRPFRASRPLRPRATDVNDVVARHRQAVAPHAGRPDRDRVGAGRRAVAGRDRQRATRDVARQHVPQCARTRCPREAAS